MTSTTLHNAILVSEDIVFVRDKKGHSTLRLAAMHRTDTVTIKLLSREFPGLLRAALEEALEYNEKRTLPCPCCASAKLPGSTATSQPSSTSVASPTRYWCTRSTRRGTRSTSLPITPMIKPVISEHDAELLTMDNFSETVLDCSKYNSHPAVLPFFTEAETSYRKCTTPPSSSSAPPRPLDHQEEARQGQEGQGRPR